MPQNDLCPSDSKNPFKDKQGPCASSEVAPSGAASEPPRIHQTSWTIPMHLLLALASRPGWQQTCEKAYTCGLSSILALFPAPSPVRQRNAFADIGLAIRDQALAVQYGRCINTSVTLLWLGVAHQAECPCRELLASSPAHPDGTLPVNRCN